MFNFYYNYIFWFLRAERTYCCFLSKNFLPVGCLIVFDNIEICAALNFTNFFIDLHSEVLVLVKTAFFLNSADLSFSFFFVTLQPCVLCIPVIKKFKLVRILYLIPKKSFCFFFIFCYFFLIFTYLCFFSYLSYRNAISIRLYFMVRRFNFYV